MLMDTFESPYEEINNEVAKMEHNAKNVNIDNYMIVDDNEPQEDYYMWMLQKVIGSIPDVIIDPEFTGNTAQENPLDNNSVVNYTDTATFKYFNSFY
jgi:hypothetical protein